MLLPIRLLWRISLPPGRRALLTGIFSASMLTSAVSIVHGVYVFSSNRNAEGIWAHVLVSLTPTPYPTLSLSAPRLPTLTAPSSISRHPPVAPRATLQCRPRRA